MGCAVAQSKKIPRSDGRKTKKLSPIFNLLNVGLKSSLCSLLCLLGGLPITMHYIIVLKLPSTWTVLPMQKFFALPMTTVKNFAKNFTRQNIFFDGEPIKDMWQVKNDCCLL